MARNSTTGKFPASQPDWNNISVIHRNVLPPRSYFFPYSSESKALGRDVEKSDSISLSGTWQFHHSTNPYEAPVGIGDLSFDTSRWGNVQVPGMWELQGYGRPQYTNVNYPFPVDPPHVPVEGNECGCYVRSLYVPERFEGHQLRLRFEGVDSSFHLYVNGEEVGYSQGARNPSEFDVTSLLKLRELNKIGVKVYKFCDGSYIEDQDQWRMSGIFRDVFLVAFAENRLEDFHIKTLLDDQYRDVELAIRVKCVGSGQITFKLLDTNQKTILEKTEEAVDGKEYSYDIQNPQKWTAETPYLYNLVLSFGGKYVSQRIGFRKTEIKDRLFLVNGKRVVFRGANRHEHNPEFGRAVPLDFMRNDLLTMKRHNINAVRTSHQPSDPRLYDLANELGLWVMDEADLECHGFGSIAEHELTGEQRFLTYDKKKALTYKEASKPLSDNPDWKDQYVDRALQLVTRDKNHPSVIMWSLGNEAFYGSNFKAMYDWIREYDETRVVHYEGDRDAETVDVYSEMYPSINFIEDFAKDASKEKPLVLCEYIHAMGNGPGNIKEYIDAFYKYPKLQGGFVWEWANHGLLTKTKDGEPYYAFGGDFGEEVHDYNFVMDGVLFSDHTPSPGLVEYAKAIEPVQLVEGSSKKNVTVINRYDFSNLDYLKCEYLYVTSQGSISGGEVAIPPGVGPGSKTTLDLKDAVTDAPAEASAITVSFSLRKDTTWASQGHQVAWFQIALDNTPKFVPVPCQATKSALQVSQSGTRLNVTCLDTDTSYVFSLVSGTLTSIFKDGEELLQSGPSLTFYRPLTDNDRPQDGWEWKDKRVNQMQTVCREVTWTSKDDSVEVIVQTRAAPPVLAWGIKVTTTYTIQNINLPDDGLLATGVHIAVVGKPEGSVPMTIPRIGLSFALRPDFKTVEWFGRGPGQSYRDFKHSQPFGYHTLPVASLWTPYEFPQESGNRTDVAYAEFVGSNARLLAIFDDAPSQEQINVASGGGGGTIAKLGSFAACHFREKDIDACTHPYELEKRRTDELHVRLDWAHHGLGTGSCGPKTLDKYALKCEPFEFGIWLV